MSEKNEKPRKRSGKTMNERFAKNQEELKMAIANVRRHVQKRPPKSPEEFEKRIDSFFAECLENGEYPTVEKFRLHLGMTETEYRGAMIFASQGAYIGELIRRGHATISAIDSELALQGTINPVLYFFRATNFYGLKNTNNTRVEFNTPTEEKRLSAKEIIELLDNTDVPINSDKFLPPADAVLIDSQSQVVKND